MLPYKRGLNKPFLIVGIRPTHQLTAGSFPYEACRSGQDVEKRAQKKCIFMKSQQKNR